MPSFVAVVDPDPGRLSLFRSLAARLLAPVPGLVRGEAVSGPACILWEASPHAPVRQAQGPDTLSVCWGAPSLPGTGQPAPLHHMANGWDPASRTPFPCYDGFHAAAVARPGSLVVGSDLLGFFPVYHASTAEVVVAASSARLVALHPLFPPEVDAFGLVGTLVWMGTVGGRGLVRDVRRLGAGRCLVWSSGRRAVERPHYELPETERADRRTEAEHLEEYRRVVQASVERQAGKGSPLGLMLSGGRDSRLLGGVLARAGIDFRPALVPNDLDAPCARLVAKALGKPLVEVSAPVEAAVDQARLQARWHHTEAGFYSAHLWGLIEPLGAVAPRVVAGFMFDRVAGGWGLNPKGIRPGGDIFERFAAVVGPTCVPPDVLRDVLRPAIRDAVDAVLAELRDAWTGCADDPNERVWRFELLHTDRAHIGLIPWRLSFGAWPVLPSLDSELLEWAVRAPVPLFANRILEDRLLSRHFPELARIPHVLMAREITDPLLPTTWHRVRRRLGLRPLGMVRTPNGGLVPRRRPYRDRRMLFDGEAWLRIREAAEPSRDALADWFDLDRLVRYLPPPGVPLGSDGAEQMGRQAIVGLMLWAGDHLA